MIRNCRSSNHDPKATTTATSTTKSAKNNGGSNNINDNVNNCNINDNNNCKINTTTTAMTTSSSTTMKTRKILSLRGKSRSRNDEIKTFTLHKNFKTCLCKSLFSVLWIKHPKIDFYSSEPLGIFDNNYCGIFPL